MQVCLNMMDQPRHFNGYLQWGNMMINNWTKPNVLATTPSFTISAFIVSFSPLNTANIPSIWISSILGCPCMNWLVKPFPIISSKGTRYFLFHGLIYLFVGYWAKRWRNTCCIEFYFPIEMGSQWHTDQYPYINTRTQVKYITRRISSIFHNKYTHIITNTIRIFNS